MKSILFATAAILIGTAPVYSQSTSEGLDLAELTFLSIDTNGDDFIDMGESHSFGEDIFVSMDSDDSALVSEAEFLAWGYGFEILAEDQDKELAYRTALRVVFSFWDRDRDGEISRTEHRVATNNDFRRADLDGDALMSETEFLSGFSVMVAIRTALKDE